MKRRLDKASVVARVNKRRRDESSQSEQSDDEEEEVQTSAVQRRAVLGVADSENDEDDREDEEVDDEEEEDDDDDMLDFTQTDYALQMSQSESVTQDDEAANKAKSKIMPPKVGQLSSKAVDDLTALLVRYMLYRGSLKLPIKFADISKDVYPKYKNVSRYFFQQAKKQLENVFGYRVVPVDDGTSKELYLVLNAASSQEHLILMNKNGKAASRGLLMMILGLLWCAPARQLSEDDLWKQLSLVDSKIKVGREHAQLGDVLLLLKTFETQLYLQATQELDNDLKKVKYYTYGPRALLEVGKVQILNFVCKEKEMDAIAAAYGSYSSSSASSDEEETAPSSLTFEGDTAAAEGADTAASPSRKRQKRDPQLQWTRSFPHVDGNWPSHVSISIPLCEQLRQLTCELLDNAQRIVRNDVMLVSMNDELHLSLSRPFVLTYNQIDAFVDELRTQLKWRKRFCIALRDVIVLVNDDKTRSFLAMQVVNGLSAFRQTLRCVDKCMERFQLPTYYEDPIPHVSIASSLGEDLAIKLSPDHAQRLFPDQHDAWTTVITAVQVVIGNKRFEILLQ